MSLYHKDVLLYTPVCSSLWLAYRNRNLLNTDTIFVFKSLTEGQAVISAVSTVKCVLMISRYVSKHQFSSLECSLSVIVLRSRIGSETFQERLIWKPVNRSLKLHLFIWLLTKLSALQLNEEPLAINPESPSQELVPLKKRRTRIADKPNYSLNLWSIMKNCIGKELSKIPMPVSISLAVAQHAVRLSGSLFADLAMKRSHERSPPPLAVVFMSLFVCL